MLPRHSSFGPSLFFFFVATVAFSFSMTNPLPDNWKLTALTNPKWSPELSVSIDLTSIKRLNAPPSFVLWTLSLFFFCRHRSFLFFYDESAPRQLEIDGTDKSKMEPGVKRFHRLDLY